jgi:hypothetical protein
MRDFWPAPDSGRGLASGVADGLFAQLMRELGIPRPDDVPTDRGAGKKDWFRPQPERRRSRVHKWVCPDSGLSMRIGIGGDPLLIHDVCSEIEGEKVFLVRHDGLRYTIYKDGESPYDSEPSVL